jgi:polysaccharide biosynthesis transport protein
MNDRAEPKAGAVSPGLGITDIYYILFRWKWMILFFCVLGVAIAFTAFILKPPRYRSHAQLYIRYVVESKSLNPPGDGSETLRLNTHEAGILDTELQILRSQDVAERVAAGVGPQKILAAMGGGNSLEAAAGVVQGYMHVFLPARGSLIAVEFEHPDPAMAREVLQQIIVAYIEKHKEMRKPAGLSGGFLSQEATRLHEELLATERRLKEAKSKAGVVSLDEEKRVYVQQKAAIREELFNAQAELAAHQAALGQLTNAVLGETSLTNGQPPLSLEKIVEYKNVCARLELFARREQELLVQFTADSTPVTNLRRQIAETQQLKKKWESENPALVGLATSSPTAAGQRNGVSADPAFELAQIRALKSKIEVLNLQLNELRDEAARIDETEDTIRDLQRKKELLEGELKYFSGSVEQSRLEETLGAGQAPNIAILQSPTPPSKGWSKPFKKKVFMLAAGCIGFGLALAFFIEMFLDRSIKRPGEIEAKLRLPLLISIPDFNRNGHQFEMATGKTPRLLAETTGAGATKSAAVSPANSPHPLQRFCDGLRDRVIVHFDAKGVKHNPKLVAVTSCGKGAGVSSVAAGLASSLSETGNGNVLLVDMNSQGGAAQQFCKGKPGCGVDAALEVEARKSARVQENLYVASQPVEGRDKLPSILPEQLTGLIPKLRASDYDYIIFDMPVVTQTSMTPRLSRLMDLVLLVVESEKTNQDVARKVISLLGGPKANITTVLNKTHSYIPRKLYQEFLDDA